VSGWLVFDEMISGHSSNSLLYRNDRPPSIDWYCQKYHGRNGKNTIILFKRISRELLNTAHIYTSRKLLLFWQLFHLMIRSR
jgi:hypothetical protein